MKRYEAYKYSGVDWIGEIPEGWEVLKNKYIFNLKKSQVGKRSNEYDLLSLTLKGVIKRDMENPEGKFPAEFDTYQEVKKDDFIFCLFDVEETPRTVGLSNFDGMITGAYTVFDTKPTADKKFLYYFYLNLDEKKRLKFLYRGLRNTIPKDSFFSFKTIFPPFSEQTAIAEFLDDKTAKIDQTIAIRQKEIELLKERRQILIQQAVTKGLDATVPLKVSGVDWIGEIPEHWEVTSVKHLLSIPITDGPHTTPMLYDEGIPFISAEAIKNNSIDFTKMRGYISSKDHLEYCKKYKPKRNDIYMIKSGATTGNIAMVETDEEFSIWSPLAVFRANFRLVPKFLFFALQSVYFKKGVELKWSYGTQQNIGMGILSNLPLVYAPIEEQTQIVSYLEDIEAKIAKAITLKEQEIEKLKEYKTVLIDNVVTGKVKINYL